MVWEQTGVLLISTPLKKLLPSNYLMENNYSRSSYLLVNKYTFQEITP